MQEAFCKDVMVFKEQIMDFKKILIAVDASDNAMRAVRYTGEMVGRTPGFKIELLHVAKPPERDIFFDEESWMAKRKELEAEIRVFFEKARAALEADGLSSDIISERYVEGTGTGVSHQILAIQHEGGFGTIVIGRRGVSKEEEFLFGSVSNKIVHYAKDCTVWVVE